MSALVRSFPVESDCEHMGDVPARSIDSMLFRHPEAARPGTPDRSQQLCKTIETEIIPRLMLMASTAAVPRAEASEETSCILPKDVTAFTGAVIEGSTEEVMAMVDAHRADGVALEAIFLDLLGPSARLLGKMWEDDSLSFSEVTIGMCKLQQTLRNYTPPFVNEGLAGQYKGKVVLWPADNEQHTFGLHMVDLLLSRDGWEVETETKLVTREAAAKVRSTSYDIAGVSVSRKDLLEKLTKDITVLRRESRNRSLSVLVGGQIFVDHPEWVTLVGADATAASGRDVVEVADGLRRARSAD